MSKRVRDYIRRHHVGLIAVFLVVSGGTAYATHPGGANTISTDDIINGQVQTLDIGAAQVMNSDIAANSIPSGKIVDETVQKTDLGAGSVGTSEVVNNNLTGNDIAEGTLSGVDADLLDGRDSSEFPRVTALADDSFPSGIVDRLETTVPGIGATLIIQCDDGGTAADGDDTVSIGVNNLATDPFQVMTHHTGFSTGGGGVTEEFADSPLVLTQNTGTGGFPTLQQHRTFFISPLGNTTTTVVAELWGSVLDPLSGDDTNCAGVIQATRSG